MEVCGDSWDAYVAETEEGPLFISFDVDAAGNQAVRSALHHCARVLIQIKAPNHNGGPSGAESEKLWEMEEDLCAALQKAGVQCRFVARVTHKGIRELVFQLADWDSFRPPVGQWIQRNADYRHRRRVTSPRRPRTKARSRV